MYSHSHMYNSFIGYVVCGHVGEIAGLEAEPLRVRPEEKAMNQMLRGPKNIH